MWTIRNSFDFNLVFNAFAGTKVAIVAQIAGVALMAISLYPFLPSLLLLSWVGAHIVTLLYRLYQANLFRLLPNTTASYPQATEALRHYTISLFISSLLWSFALLFLEDVPPSNYYFLYIIIGFTFIFAFKASATYLDIYKSLLREHQQLKEAYQELHVQNHNNEQYLNAIDKIGIGTIATDINGTIVKTNETIREWFGNLDGENYFEFIQSIASSNALPPSHEIEVQNGHTYEVVTTTITNIEKKPYTLYIFKNITKQKEQRKILSKLALQYKQKLEFDPLTNIYNRTAFLTAMEKAVYETDRKFSKLALLFIDIDGFKEINDTFGHDIGDQVLRIIAKRLRNSIQESDLLARFAGDEFIVTLKNIQNHDIAQKIATNILYNLSKPFSIQDNIEIYVTASIGISIYPDDTDDLQELIKHADLAMYAIKQKSKNNFKFYKEVS